jgi:hypothetical protein
MYQRIKKNFPLWNFQRKKEKKAASCLPIYTIEMPV